MAVTLGEIKTANPEVKQLASVIENGQVVGFTFNVEYDVVNVDGVRQTGGKDTYDLWGALSALDKATIQRIYETQVFTIAARYV